MTHLHCLLARLRESMPLPAAVCIRRRALAWVAALALLPAATPPALAAGTLRVAIPQDATSLDPIATSDNASIHVQLLVYDTLVRPSTDGQRLEPGLATSWSASDGGRTMTFKLRDAKFADGKPVTAQDVEYSLERAGSETSRWKRFFAAIKGVETPDAKTVVVRLDKPFTPLLNNLALFSSAIVPKGSTGAFFDKPVGSGPFVVQSWSKGQGIVLVRNPHYWQAPKPSLDRVELQVIPEPNSRVLKLQAGEIDVALEIPHNQVQTLQRNASIKTDAASVLRSEFVLMNTRRKPFDDVRVRQAMNLAVDKEGLVKGLLFGHGRVAASPIPPMAYADPALKPYPYDPAKAKELLAAAGLASGFKTTLLVNAGLPLQRQIAQAVQASLAAVGVTAEIRLVEGGAHWATTKDGNYDMAVAYATSDTIDVDQLVGFLLVNPERANAYHTEWRSDRVNELYEAERRTPDGDERGKMFREIVSLGQQGAPSIFLFHPQAAYAWRDKVQGMKVLPTSNYRLEDVSLK